MGELRKYCSVFPKIIGDSNNFPAFSSPRIKTRDGDESVLGGVAVWVWVGGASVEGRYRVARELLEAGNGT